MKAPDYFIKIPSTEGDWYYIKPFDILNLREGGQVTRVCYKEDCAKTFTTLLTAQEIHERIKELEYESFKFTFGEE